MKLAIRPVFLSRTIDQTSVAPPPSRYPPGPGFPRRDKWEFLGLVLSLPEKLLELEATGRLACYPQPYRLLAARLDRQSLFLCLAALNFEFATTVLFWHLLASSGTQGRRSPSPLPSKHCTADFLVLHYLLSLRLSSRTSRTSPHPLVEITGDSPPAEIATYCTVDCAIVLGYS